MYVIQTGDKYVCQINNSKSTGNDRVSTEKVTALNLVDLSRLCGWLLLVIPRLQKVLLKSINLQYEICRITFLTKLEETKIYYI